MQVPSAFFNPLMSWKMQWVYQLPLSFRAWEWCHLPRPCLGPGFCTAEPLDNHQQDKVGPGIWSSDFQILVGVQMQVSHLQSTDLESQSTGRGNLHV